MQLGFNSFAYKDLHIDTKDFKTSELLGRGGFGEGYKGILPASSIPIATNGHLRLKNLA